ncbi:hypothetical protein N8134_04345, partial [Flavobacteriales bacterium]|nr:hypothetical protein [Flavobacteriales bacterium]
MNQSSITRLLSAAIVIVLGIFSSNEVSAQATLDSSVVDKSIIGNRAFTTLNLVKLDRKLDTLVQRTDSLRLDTDSLYSQFVVLDNPMDMNIQSLTNVNIDSGTFDGSTVTASGAVTGGSLTDGTATLSSGALSGATTGSFSSTVSAATGSTVGTLTLEDGSITDSSGAIDFGNENLSTTGTAASGNLTVTGTGSFSSTVSAATGSTVGTLTLEDGSITDSSGAIDFGNENLSTTGTLGAGVATLATGSAVGNLT